MTKILETVPNKSLLKALEDLKGRGFNPIYLASPKYNLKQLRRMSPEELSKVKRILLSIDSGYYKRLKRDSRPYVKKEEFQQYLLEATLERLSYISKSLASKKIRLALEKMKNEGLIESSKQGKKFLYWWRLEK